MWQLGDPVMPGPPPVQIPAITTPEAKTHITPAIS